MVNETEMGIGNVKSVALMKRRGGEEENSFH